MVKLILSGGLGNQMFQYAAARILSLKLQTELSVDLCIFERKSRATPRKFALGIFGICPPIINSVRNKLLVISFSKFMRYKWGRKLLKLINVFNESKGIQTYDDAFEHLDDEITLFGYFQNVKYFQDQSFLIRKDFSFKNITDAKNLAVVEQIDKTNSISLHIRRGDYLNQNSNLVVLDIEYYLEAIKYIGKKIEDPYYFIFSDDIEWVKQNLNFDDFNYQYIDWNKGNESYIDMQLTSMCKHNIIANSSFSWWGAWLNDNPDKVVIAPSVWYKNQKKNEYPDGFLPKQWITI